MVGIQTCSVELFERKLWRRRDTDAASKLYDGNPVKRYGS